MPLVARPLRLPTLALVTLALAATALAACGASSELDRASFGPQSSPEETLRAYMRVLELRVKDSDLGLFTPETRRLRIGAESRDTQQAGELRSLQRAIGSIRVRYGGDVAVIFFSAGDRKNPPYFFRRSPDGWMLDLATSREIVAFDQANEWRLRTRDHDYAFAFEDR